MNRSSSNAHTATAIVVGLDCITGLQTARILAQRGIPVIGVASDPAHYCCRTRVCRKIVTADTAGEALIEALERIAADLPEKGLLIPCSDASVLAIARHADRLGESLHVRLPACDTVEMLIDKMRLYDHAKKAGLPIPATYFLHRRADAVAAAAELSYPCILKPPMKTPRWERNTKIKAYRAADAAELLSLYDRCSAWADVLMAQQWVEGTDADLYSFNGYFDDESRPLATFIARKLRQWPPHTGTSCLGQECRNDVVLETAVQLFQSVGYRGLGYVEMKRDSRTGEHFLIEPNVGRPTGRSAIAEAGGVEILYTLYCDTYGLPLPKSLEQEYRDVKWIYWRRDLQSAWYYWKRGDLTLRQWWQSVRGRKGCAVFSLSDPGPFLADGYKAVGMAVSRILGKLRPAPAKAVCDSSTETC